MKPVIRKVKTKAVKSPQYYEKENVGPVKTTKNARPNRRGHPESSNVDVSSRK